MKKLTALAAAALVAGSFATVAQAADFSKQITARQALMQVYAFNLGQLAAMVKGQAPYDATAASNAAGNLMAAAKMKNGAMWPKGSDAGQADLAGKTRAKPDIWAAGSKIGEASMALAMAAEKLAGEAGNGLDALKANFGAVGGACGGCHKPFRAPKN